jgi:hypothetical protein
LTDIHFDTDITSKMSKYFVVAALSVFAFSINSSAFAPPSKPWSSSSLPTGVGPRVAPQEQQSMLQFSLPSCASKSTALFGIPKMFRWLTDQYPDIINNRLEEGLAEDIAVDNFYLDMNGIIHP